MTYQTTIFVPWAEKNAMEWFDGKEDITCVKEDTRGKIYKTDTFTTTFVEDGGKPGVNVTMIGEVKE